MAQDSDNDPAVVKQTEDITPTFEEITLNSSLGSGENLQDYMDDSLLESLNKTEPEELPGKYNRSQSCASNISNQSKAGL